MVAWWEQSGSFFLLRRRLFLLRPVLGRPPFGPICAVVRPTCTQLCAITKWLNRIFRACYSFLVCPIVVSVFVHQGCLLFSSTVLALFVH